MVNEGSGCGCGVKVWVAGDDEGFLKMSERGDRGKHVDDGKSDGCCMRGTRKVVKYETMSGLAR